MEKRFVRILTMPLAFTVRIPSQKIYISTICIVRMMSERFAAVRVPCMVRHTFVICLGVGECVARIPFDRCISFADVSQSIFLQSEGRKIKL